MMGARGFVLMILALAASVGHTADAQPTLRYDKPGGFAGSAGDEVETWISNGLDGVIQVYPFRPSHADFHGEFRRALFRERIIVPYREDRLLAAPTFNTLTVSGADAALSASFKNFNGGAPREHLRVAILSAGLVALVDVSANSPQAFERNWPSVSRLLNSLRVVRVGL
jgi:hypothetical protein